MTRNTAEIRAAYYGARPRESRFNVHAVEMRDDSANDTFHVRGFASVTEAPYEVNDWLGSYSETVARGAFGKSLNEQDDVRFLINHDGIPLARTSSGTLTLREITNPADDPSGRGQTGLWVEADLDSASPLAQTLRSAMKRGDVSQMSFAFQALRQEWNADYSERTITEVRMFDVSAVAFPASPSTSIQLDSRDLAELVGRVESGKPLTAAERDLFRDIVGRFNALDDDESEERGDESAADDGPEDFDSERVQELAAEMRAIADAVVAKRQNKLDALKRRYTN